MPGNFSGMIIAIPVTGTHASGPGEAQQIVLIDTSEGKEIERYENPALTAMSGRGIAMLNSVIQRKVDALVVGGIGEHAMSYAKGRVKVLNGSGLTLQEITEKASKNSLPEMTEANHSGHHHHH